MDGRTGDVAMAMALLASFAKFALEKNPQVAMGMLPVAFDWAESLGIPADKLQSSLSAQKPELVAEAVKLLKGAK